MTERRAWNSTLPAATKRIQRKTPLRNRGRSRFPKRRDKAYTEWIKTLPCVLFALHECWGPIDPAHVFKTRACGARDKGEVVPLCRKAHDEQEGRTVAFVIEWGVNLRRIAKELERLYEEEHGRTLGD